MDGRSSVGRSVGRPSRVLSLVGRRAPPPPRPASMASSAAAANDGHREGEETDDAAVSTPSMLYMDSSRGYQPTN